MSYCTKRERARKEQLRLEAIRHAEHILDGQAHCEDGHNPQLRTVRGPCKVGGISLQTIQEKKKKMWEEAAASGGLISDADMVKQIIAVEQQTKQVSSKK